VINGILWKIRTGAPWRDLPERYGPWKTCHEPLRRWSCDGAWDRILAEVTVKDDSVGAVEWVISVDSTVVRAHQHAAGARKKGMVIADKAYSHPSTRTEMRYRRICFTCPERSDQIARRKAKGSAGGRPPAFDAQAYEHRNVVERCFNRLKQFRDLATRYAKRLAYYQAGLTIAAIVLWLRQHELQDTP